MMDFFSEQYKAKIRERNATARARSNRAHQENLQRRNFQNQARLSNERKAHQSHLFNLSQENQLIIQRKLQDAELSALRHRKADHMEGTKLLHDQLWNSQITLYEHLLVELISAERRCTFGSLLVDYSLYTGDLPLSYTLVLDTIGSSKLIKLAQAFLKSSLTKSRDVLKQNTDMVTDSELYVYVTAGLLRTVVEYYPKPGKKVEPISMILFEFLVSEPIDKVIDALGEHIWYRGVGIGDELPDFLKTEEAQFIMTKLFNAIPSTENSEKTKEFMLKLLMTDEFEMGNAQPDFFQNHSDISNDGLKAITHLNKIAKDIGHV